MTALWLDVRYALRTMARAPGWTMVVVVTLALGIGATTTIFSVIHAVILRPLPYDRADRLMRVYTQLIGKRDAPRLGVAVPGFRELSRDCRSCAAAAAWTQGAASLATADRAVRLRTTWATHELLPLLGVRPALGRWFDASEDRPGDPQVAVLGHDVWQRLFAGDPGIVGRQVHVDAMPVTVIGVMPRGFQFPEREELWLPAGLDFAATHNDTSYYLSVIVRLAPSASPASLRDELAVYGKHWTDTANAIGASLALPPTTIDVRTAGFQDDLIGSLASALWLLQAAVLLVFLIAVVNVANLLLARAESRSREVAVRHALGASHRRLLRQFLTESVLLGLCGGALGILVAMWAQSGVVAMLPREAPRVDEIALDGTGVAFAVACAIAAALLFGIAPIVHARRSNLHAALKDGASQTAGKARLRTRRALVIGEIALAVVLVVGCSVMVRSFLRLQRVELGFAPDHLLSFGLELPERAYPPAAADAFWHRLADRMRALPGVRHAALVQNLPPAHPSWTNAITLPGRSPRAPGEPDWKTDNMQIFDDDAVQTLGARIVRGRGFSASDAPGAPPVALINASFAATLMRGRDPIGQKVQLLFNGMPAFTVVGVIADIKTNGVDQPAGAELILPLWQFSSVWAHPVAASRMYCVLRTTGEPQALIPAIQQAVAELDPGLAAFELRTLDDAVWEAVARPRFLMFLLIAFAASALLLAAIGIYGVMAHTVAQRTREIGLRVALGARPGQVRAMVLRQAGALVAVGGVAGLAVAITLAAALDGALRTLFYGEPLVQPVVLAGVVVGVTAAALLATWIPVRRATEVQPTVALRTE